MGSYRIMARALRILFVEDNEDDVSLVRRATRLLDGGHELIRVSDGHEAVNWLQGGGKAASAPHRPFPNLILVDLMLPGMDGFDFLDWLRRQAHLRAIPAIILSASMLESDVARAYLLGAKGYLSKPTDFEDLVKQLRALYGFWSNCEFASGPGAGRVLNQPG